MHYNTTATCRVCVRACVRACVCACVRVRLQLSTSPPQSHLGRTRRYPSRQRMDSPASCAANCAVPTADESSHSAARTLHPHPLGLHYASQVCVGRRHVLWHSCVRWKSTCLKGRSCFWHGFWHFLALSPHCFQWGK